MEVIHSRRGTDASGEQATGWPTSVKMALRVLQDPKEFPVAGAGYATGLRRVSPPTAVSFESPEDLRTLRDPRLLGEPSFGGKFANCKARILQETEKAEKPKEVVGIISKRIKCAKGQNYRGE